MKSELTWILLFLAITTGCGKRDFDSIQVPENQSPPILKPVTTPVNNQVKGFYEAIPEFYYTSSEQLPAMVFLHGAAQFGNGYNDLPMLLQEGITQLLYEQRIPASFTSKGRRFSMIYFSPQFSSEFSASALDNFLQFIKRNYRIDTSRIYLAGISGGGELACKFAADFPRTIAAVISMGGGIAEDQRQAIAQSIAINEVPIWAIHNTGDEVIPYSNSEIFLALIHQYNPTLSDRLTLLPPEGPLNHDCWTRTTDPDFRENNMNIYEWALQFQK